MTATFRDLIEEATPGASSGYSPYMYLSTTKGSWQVIAGGMPVGRPSDRQGAEAFYQEIRKLGRDARRPAVWDGNLGDWDWHR